MLKLSGDLQTGDLRTPISKFSWHHDEGSALNISYEMFGFNFGTFSYAREGNLVADGNIVRQSRAELVYGTFLSWEIYRNDTARIALSIENGREMQSWLLTQEEASFGPETWRRDIDHETYLMKEWIFKAGWVEKTLHLSGLIVRGRDLENPKSYQKFEIPVAWHQ
jgi:hypothetical protein